ncbi:hypothetical protein PoB_001969400 [Plakobranchus ocellatus]|uniref:Uncharacterized protein n=1 Tax=Plakobranchus ocellatus TaxID=259542 RepID=A0AAV3ZH18_9GAST|nr:hypothetical protein PoB_001969400 [Plakobranchus ocellatus]
MVFAINTLYKTDCSVEIASSPQQGDLRLLGPSSDLGPGGGARTRVKRVPADLEAGAQTTEPQAPPNFNRASPHRSDLRLSGSSRTGGGAQSRDRWVPTDLRADSLATLPKTPLIQGQEALFVMCEKCDNLLNLFFQKRTATGAVAYTETHVTRVFSRKLRWAHQSNHRHCMLILTRPHPRYKIAKRGTTVAKLEKLQPVNPFANAPGWQDVDGSGRLRWSTLTLKLDVLAVGANCPPTTR